MVESSPFVTTIRGSYSKSRRNLSRTKTDLDGLFDDIPQDGSPLLLQLLKELNIKIPVGTTTAPEANPASEDDNICTNLMSLLVTEMSGPDTPDNFVNEFGGVDQPPAKKKRKVEKLSPTKKRRPASRRTTAPTNHPLSQARR